MIPSKIVKFLDKSKVKYETIEHRTVFTAYDKAATLRVKPNVIGKTLVVKADNELVLVLVPGNKNFDKNKFKKVINGAKKKQGLKMVKGIDFISEKVMKNKFKGIKIGAVPPFGGLWNLPTFIDKGLMEPACNALQAKRSNAGREKIFVNSGIYEASFKVSPKAFEKLGAILGNFTMAKK